MAFTTERRSVVLGRPPGRALGKTGLISPQAISDRSVSYPLLSSGSTPIILITKDETFQTPSKARPGGRPRTTDLRSVVNAILYLLRSGCQWRLLPLQFPPWGTVYSYFRSWEAAGVWVQLQRTVYEKVRMAASREACPSVVIM